MPFQLNAKNIFLTYPRCPIAKEILLDKLRTLFPTANIRVGHEHHADEGSHLHVFINSPTAIRLKGVAAQRHFDIDGYHPNIQSARRPKECLEYVSKENDYIDAGTFNLESTGKWADLIHAGSRQEFLDAVKTNYPRDFILSYDRIVHYADAHYAIVAPPYKAPELEFNTDLFPDLENWVNQDFHGPRPKSLLLIGASRTGKTAWARNWGTHMYFNGMFCLDLWNDDARYAIFDDFSDWSKFYQYKQFLGAQEEFIVTDKYRHKLNKKWGKPCIVLSNTMPNFADMDWTFSNCFTVCIGNNKLF